MKRLQQKCALASAGLHLVLILTFLFASAFQRSREPSTDAASASRGPGPMVQIFRPPPEAEPPAVAPAASAAAVQPNLVPRVVSDAPVPVPDRDSVESGAPRPRLPRISTNLVSRAGNSRPVSPRPTDTDARRDRIGQEIQGILAGISGGAPIAVNLTPGGVSGAGGDSYQQFVKETYSQSWNPHSVAAGEGVAGVKVVIGSDGKVLSAQLIRPSGNTALDESVRRALAQVRFIRPFEPGARESQRSYTIDFDMTARKP